jgi:hypothetical protein
VKGGPVIIGGPDGISVRSLPGWSGWEFRLIPRRVGGRPAVGAIEVIAPVDTAINPDRLRRVPFGTLAKLATDSWPHVTAVAANLAPEPRALRAYSSEHLNAVVTIYRYAISQGVPPRRVLAEHFGVSDKTVDRWLRRARQKYLLGDWHDERAEHELTPETWAERERRSESA